jgi:hypothetical protein
MSSFNLAVGRKWVGKTPRNARGNVRASATLAIRASGIGFEEQLRNENQIVYNCQIGSVRNQNKRAARSTIR